MTLDEYLSSPECEKSLAVIIRYAMEQGRTAEQLSQDIRMHLLTHTAKRSR